MVKLQIIFIVSSTISIWLDYFMEIQKIDEDNTILTKMERWLTSW